jgi:hypothetical protein
MSLEVELDDTKWLNVKELDNMDISDMGFRNLL